jgi:hypothetical protein
MPTLRVVFASTLLVFATGALAGTKVQMNIVPTPPDCVIVGLVCLNVPGPCGGDNADCALGTMSSKSKVKLDGKLGLKATIKGVTDIAGVLMTTGPAEDAADNLVLALVLSLCPVDTGAPPICDDLTSVYLKVVLTKGKGKLKVDLAPVLSLAAGDPVAVLGARLVVPGSGPGDCPGTNSTADITGRLNDSTCDPGIVRGVGGVVTQ